MSPPWMKEIPNEYFASYVTFPILVKLMDFFPICPVQAQFPKQGKKHCSKILINQEAVCQFQLTEIKNIPVDLYMYKALE
jgi:hypothetical protein